MLVALDERVKLRGIIQAVSREWIQDGMMTGINREAGKVVSKFERPNSFYEVRNPGVWGLCHTMGPLCDCIS